MAGFFQIDNAVLDLLPTIKPTGLAVYAYLCRCADADGECFPSTEQIGEVVGLEKRQLRTVLATLDAAGLIKRRKRQKRLLFTVLTPQSQRQSIADCKEHCGNPLPKQQPNTPYSGNLLPKHTGSLLPKRQSIAEKAAINCRANKDEQYPTNNTQSTTTIAREDTPAVVRGLVPLLSADELTKNDLLQITMGFNGGVPGPAWDEAIRAAVTTALSRDATVTRADLLRIARERGDKPPSPGKDRLFLEDLTAAICDAFRRPQTVTSTEPDPATLLANQPPKDALRPSILAEAQATFAAARARKAARAEREANRFGSVLQ